MESEIGLNKASRAFKPLATVCKPVTAALDQCFSKRCRGFHETYKRRSYVDFTERGWVENAFQNLTLDILVQLVDENGGKKAVEIVSNMGVSWNRKKEICESCFFVHKEKALVLDKAKTRQTVRFWHDAESEDFRKRHVSHREKKVNPL